MKIVSYALAVPLLAVAACSSERKRDVPSATPEQPVANDVSRSIEPVRSKLYPEDWVPVSINRLGRRMRYHQ